MKHVATYLLLAAACAAIAADPQVPRKVWTVETSAPVPQRLDLKYGETIDLQCRFLSYAAAMDILGGAVTLHGRTNGMAEGSSFQAAGTAGSNGIASVRLAVDAWLPQNLTNVSWTLECVQTNAVRLLRASGTAWLTGTSAASSNDPVPAVWLPQITAQIAAATGALAQASASALVSVSQSIAQVSAAALTNRVTTWPDPEDSLAFWVDNGTNRVRYLKSIIGTNLTVSLSSDFSEGVASTRPAWTNNAYPFNDWPWVGIIDGVTLQLTYSDMGIWEGSAANGYPATLYPDTGTGTAVVSIASYQYSTNSGTYYSLTTGDVWKAVATVAQAAADAQGAAEAAQADINGHAPPGTIAAPHLLLGDRALIDAVPGKVNAAGGTLTNGYISGALTFLNTQPTNLVGRLFATNNVLLIEWSAQ